MYHHIWLELGLFSNDRFREAQGLCPRLVTESMGLFPEAFSLCWLDLGIFLPTLPYQAPKFSPVNQHQLLLLSESGLGRHKEEKG